MYLPGEAGGGKVLLLGQELLDFRGEVTAQEEEKMRV